MPGNLRAREKEIAEASHTSSVPLDVLQDVIALPEDVSGLVVYDVGSGTSSAVSELRKRGVQAYGIDPGYRNVSRLLSSARKYAMRLGQTRDYQRAQLAAMEAFRQDYQRNRDRYKAAFAGDLPFEDNSGDIVFSELAISHFLVRDRDVLFQAVDEGLRVLKPREEGVAKERRSLVLHPWKPPYLKPDQLQNAQALEASLRARGIPFTIEAIRNVPEASPRLRIIKP